MNHDEKLADGHAYVVIAPFLNFCGHYSRQYGHCGCTHEEHASWEEQTRQMADMLAGEMTP